MQRQQALLVAEAWQNIYSNQTYVDFQSYSQDNLVNAIISYVQVNYPTEFSDWITNSEFVIKVRTLAWLHQNISYRHDLDIRENFTQTATRRDSILMLADNVFYNANRCTGASGELRISSISTTQPLIDSNNTQLSGSEIFWNDPSNTDWYEQFILIMNSAFVARTQFGFPLVRYTNSPTRVDLYMFNSLAPSGGVYPFSVNSSGTNLPFEFVNVTLSGTTGVLSELPPNPNNALRIYYRSDGLGSGSINTGFFIPIKQGSLSHTDQNFSNPTPMQQVILSATNINNTDVFVQQLDDSGNVLLDWTEVDTVFGQGVSFNSIDSSTQSIYEISTLINDNVLVQFGDGKFGAIPADNFRFWYRTSSALPQIINPDDIQHQVFLIPYVSNNTIYFLTITASLETSITNASGTDTNTQISQNIGASYAAQNRMVTGADYNLFPLSDTSILKLKTVNRTYSGHSPYSKISDPTGLYTGIKFSANDGRIFRASVIHNNIVSADIAQITINEIVLQYIQPVIQTADKTTQYFASYPESITTGSPIWSQTSVINLISSGNFEKSNNIIPVGYTATDEFQYLLPGSFIRCTSSTGPLISVQNVAGNGTGFNGVSLGGTLASGTSIYSIIPTFRTQFDASEITQIINCLTQLQDFALSWNQGSQAWNIIINSNIDKIDPFSLANQGNTSNSSQDASWLVYVYYIPAEQSGAGNKWGITDRGLSIVFESARQGNFSYLNSGYNVDPYSGQLVIDNIDILGINEAKNSQHRLGTGETATYLINDQIWNCSGPELSPDGYVDASGLQVVPVDSQHNGIYDNPVQFSDFVIEDGTTDLVLWRSVVANGFSVWQAIDTTTTPRGLYGFSNITGVSLGTVVNQAIYTYGDIYFDQTANQWLIADSLTGNWIYGAQNGYQLATGRSGLKFLWTHYPSDNSRIDPAISNIMDVYVLTQAYDTAYRNWISGGFVGVEPIAPTAESLQISYSYLNNYKVNDDQLIFNPISYKPLFGVISDPGLQANFLIIQSAGSTLSENELILKVIQSIDGFFAANNWDLGESFYFTELVAYIHRECAPDLQSCVPVSKNSLVPFGELFQLRTTQDELFISAAQPSDIIPVQSYTNINLQVGTLAP